MTSDGAVEPSARIDITREVCPMTYVRVKLALERLEPGQVLEVRLKGEEPRRNVPRSAEDDGHQVLSQTEEEGGVLRLWVRVGAS